MTTQHSVIDELLSDDYDPNADNSAADAVDAADAQSKPLTLTCSQDGWTVLTPLLNKLTNTVGQRFPEEVVNDLRFKAAYEQEAEAIKKQTNANTALVQAQKVLAISKQHENLVNLQQVKFNQYLSCENSYQAIAASYISAEINVNNFPKEGDASVLLTLQQTKDSLLADKTAAKLKRDTIKTSLDQTKQDRLVAQQSLNTEVTALVAPLAVCGDSALAATSTASLLAQDSGTNALAELSLNLGTLKTRFDKQVTKANAETTTYKNAKEKLAKTYQKKRDAVNVAIKKVKALREDRTTDGDGKFTDPVALSKALGELADVTPSIYGETVADFKAVSDSAEYQEELTAAKAKLTAKFDPILKSPGDKKSATVEIEGGVAIGVLGAKVTGTYTMGFTIEAQKFKDGRIIATTKVANKVKIKSKLGADVTGLASTTIQAGVEGGLEIGKERMYSSMDDFVSKECGLKMTALMTGTGVIKKKGRESFNEAAWIKKSEQLLAQGNLVHDKLDANLTMLGAKDAKVKLKLVQQKDVKFVSTWTKNASFSGSANAETRVSEFGAGVSLKVGVKGIEKQSYTHISFLDDISEQPVLQKIHAQKKPKSFGFYQQNEAGLDAEYVTGDKALRALDQIEKDIAVCKNSDTEETQDALTAHRTKLLTSMKYLRQEYDNYIQIKNVVDHKGKEDVQGAASKQQLLIEKQRDAESPAEYVQAMTLQFARLRGLYESSYDSIDDIETSVVEDTERFANDLKVPRMKISQADREKTFKVKGITEKAYAFGYSGSLAFDVSAGPQDPASNIPKGKVSVAIGLSYEDKAVPNFPNEENVKIKLNVDSHAKGANYVADMLNVKTLKDMFGSDSVALKEEMSGVLKNITDGSVEFNLTKRHGAWVLKNAKGYAETDVTIGGTLSIGAGIEGVVGLRVKTSNRQVKNIHFGDHTLHAMPDVFRAKHFKNKVLTLKEAANAPDEDKAWNDFCDSGITKKMALRLRLEYAQDDKGLMTELESTQSKDDKKYSEQTIKRRLRNDLDQWKFELKKDGFADEVKAFEAAFKEGKGDTDACDKALRDLIRVKVARDNNVIKNNFIKRRKLNFGDVNDYAAERIGTEIDKVLDQHQVALFKDNPKDIVSVDQLADRAKKLYKKTPSTDNFKLLKRSLAIEYASKRLNELTQYGDHEDTNKAIALLGSEIDGIFESDKVYLNDRVDGKLVEGADGIEVEPIIRKLQSKSINQSEIESETKKKFSGLAFKLKPTKCTWSTGSVKPWKASNYSDSHKKAHIKRQSSKRFNLHSVRTKRQLFKRIDISSAIETVMKQRNKKRLEQQRAKVNRQRSSSQSEK